MKCQTNNHLGLRIRLASPEINDRVRIDPELAPRAVDTICDPDKQEYLSIT